MQQGFIGEDKLVNMVEHPGIYASKENVPVALYGKLVDNPTLNDHGQIRPLGVNIDHLVCIQLDYDDGRTIDSFVEEFKDQFQFLLYTSFSYGFKENDRFRVIIPLDEPLHCMRLNCYFKRAMANIFKCDDSAFDRGHMQCIPAIRDPQAPYRYYVNTSAPLFHIPWRNVKLEEEKAVATYTFNLAVQAWWEECDHRLGRRRDVPDSEELKRKALMWAQEQFDTCTVGARNTTMFKVLTWLKSKGIDPNDAYMLSPPVGISDEYDKMIERIFFEM